jgi:hypothetical protein
MAERATSIRSSNLASDLASDLVDELMAALDAQELGRKVQAFGRRSPVALMLAALTVGVAAGILLRKKIPEVPGQQTEN